MSVHPGGRRFLAADLPPLRDLVDRYVAHVMAETGGDRALAATILGVHPRTLARRGYPRTPPERAVDARRVPGDHPERGSDSVPTPPDGVGPV